MGFTINIAKGIKKKPVSSKPNKVSRLCTGVTVKENDKYMIRISLVNDPDFPDYLVIPFTEKSLSLVGKEKVFGRNKDEHGNHVCYIRDKRFCTFHPGLPSQYTAVVEKEVCSGYVVRINGKLYFDMLDIHGIGENVHNLPVRLDENKPLFPQTNEHNTD